MHKDSSDSLPAYSWLFSHNVMPQLVWRLAQPQPTAPTPPLLSPPCLYLSHWDQPTKMSSFRLTDLAVPAHSSKYFMRVMQSVAGVVALMKAPHLLDAEKTTTTKKNNNSLAEKILITNMRPALDFEQDYLHTSQISLWEGGKTLRESLTITWVHL